ncbi:hypothetical protein Ccrd_005318 [Cynara cardunculus var. scolymus]|uniref:Uncharacterized protein n=1 Tax=Cynara cardunculus var. scolymus TaxID=59895 RepID=A0A103XKY2_CYNCS|nr:hypothetical protein Ccrd_005318 [Cynara cardunculus var. scolymus]
MATLHHRLKTQAMMQPLSLLRQNLLIIITALKPISLLKSLLLNLLIKSTRIQIMIAQQTITTGQMDRTVAISSQIGLQPRSMLLLVAVLPLVTSLAMRRNDGLAFVHVRYDPYSIACPQLVKDAIESELQFICCQNHVPFHAL